MTLRRLTSMYRGKDKQQWWHTASLMALFANCHRDPKKRAQPFSAAEFHPYERRRGGGGGMALTAETMSTFAAMLVSPEKAKAAAERVAREQKLVEEMTSRQLLRLARAA
jgi:hypothetical protein